MRSWRQYGRSWRQFNQNRNLNQEVYNTGERYRARRQLLSWRSSWRRMQRTWRSTSFLREESLMKEHQAQRTPQRKSMRRRWSCVRWWQTWKKVRLSMARQSHKYFNIMPCGQHPLDKLRSTSWWIKERANLKRMTSCWTRPSCWPARWDWSTNGTSWMRNGVVPTWSPSRRRIVCTLNTMRLKEYQKGSGLNLA